MARSPTRSKPRKGRPRRDRGWAWPPLIFAWTLLVQLTFLAGCLDRAAPTSLFLGGDGADLVASAQEIFRGGDRARLGPATPLTVTLLAGLRHLLPEGAFFPLAAKVSMVVLDGLLFALLYIPLSERIPRLAAPICLLLPLSFGELALVSGVSSEIPYRLLLLVLLTLGWRLPAVAGPLHVLAVATRPEHLFLVLALGAWASWRLPGRRRALAIAAVSGLAFLTAWSSWAHGSWTLPTEVLRDDPSAALTEALGKGDPQPSTLSREGATSAWAAAFHAAPGWTWRDFPERSTWLRRPQDLAYSATSWYALVSALLVGLGVWRVRSQKDWLPTSAVVTLYLGVLVLLGAPPVRTLMIASPLFLTFFALGGASLLGSWERRGLTAALVVLALLHLPSAHRPRRYLERLPPPGDAANATATLVYQGVERGP